MLLAVDICTDCQQHNFNFMKIKLQFLINLLFLSLSHNLIAQNRVEKLLSLLNNPESQQVMVTAHRGDWFWAPENSTKAIRNCIEMGVDMIEIDVRLSRDGVPVIIHDLTLDRTTTGTGYVAAWTLDSLKTLYLKDATNVVTPEQIPTLEEVLKLTKGKILVYLDKSIDRVDKLIPVLKKTGTLNQAVFVLDFTYAKARKQFGTYLDSVVYVPVIADGMDQLEAYIDTYLAQLKPKAFQFRMGKFDGGAYDQLEKILSSGSKAFVAATWPHHTIGHDDQVSRKSPDEGWGWLIDQGFTILETNRPEHLIRFLQNRKLHP